MKREIRFTKDGSHSIYLPEMDEQYHSHHGSIVEAKKVYIEYGLERLKREARSEKPDLAINIFEMGFGTGLNALLTSLYAKENQLKINYFCIEKYPVTEEEMKSLNYPNELSADPQLFNQLHEANWESWGKIDEGFNLFKTAADLREAELPKDLDLVYFDAFAPEKQPHLWTEEIFQKLYNSLSNGGLMTTYCVKGEVRRKLQKVGFQIEKLNGPKGGKREVLRARKE